MTTDEGKQVRAVIQGLTQRQGPTGPYYVLSAEPRQGMRYPDNYNIRDAKLVEGLQPGDTVMLSLVKGKPKVENPQTDKDWWWDTVGIDKGAVTQPSPGPSVPQPPEGTPNGNASIERMHREKTAAIEKAHRENLIAMREEVRARCLQAAAEIVKTNTFLKKEPVDPEAVKRLALDYEEWVKR